MNNVKSYEQTHASSLCAGTILRGRYRVEKTLGQGGFGITYCALDLKTNTRVAVKELFPARNVMRADDHKTVQVQLNQDATFQYLRESFEKEAKVLIELQNLEGVVRLMHVFSENNTVYYVMELLEGEPLIQRLKREGPMNWENFLPILLTIMKALEQIHAVGLIHRDVSPDNIFLTKSGARLIDFGSVRNYQDETPLTAMVKRNFAPWEQFLTNGHQGPWTDIYALSVTAYYSLCGQLPPPATERRMKDTLVPLELLCPTLPKDACAAIQGGMAVLPEQRFQNVGQFLKALNLDATTHVTATAQRKLVCLRGHFSGMSWQISQDRAFRIGRQPDCDIRYPGNYPGVSRVQCTIYHTKDGKCIVRDERSSYGTRLASAGKNVQLDPYVWYAADGAHLLFGAHEEYFLTR